ncbi:exonuclease domain-containing protein [Roseovarius sp. S4756]|uniref:3'-5' exonuclease n=1 Tax=Roseovarius maritimus TaxID=3342637 RepID=UPI003726F116
MKQDFEGLSHYAFIDFEASGLGPNSWPIEIGVSRILETGKVETWSSLIMRHATWLPEHWSPVSEQVHGIPFLSLDAAPPAEDVLRAFKKQVGNRLIVADAPRFDGAWLRKLSVAAATDPSKFTIFDLIDYHQVAFDLLDDVDLDRVYEFLETHKAPHRAGPDSRRLARALVEAIKKS